jgi:hypothetical protein
MKTYFVLFLSLCATLATQAQTNLRQHEIVAGYPMPYFGYRYHFDDTWAARLSASYEPEVDMFSFKPLGSRFMPRIGGQYYLTDKKIRVFALSELVMGFGYHEGRFDINYTENEYADGVMRSNLIGLGIGAGAEMLLWKRLSIAAYLQPIYMHTQQTITSTTLDIVSSKRLESTGLIWDYKVSLGYRF